MLWTAARVRYVDEYLLTKNVTRHQEAEWLGRQLANIRARVKSACDRAGIAFYCGWPDPKMTEEERSHFLIKDSGAKIIGAPNRTFADLGRRLTKRVMPV